MTLFCKGGHLGKQQGVLKKENPSKGCKKSLMQTFRKARSTEINTPKSHKKPYPNYRHLDFHYNLKPTRGGFVCIRRCFYKILNNKTTSFCYFFRKIKPIVKIFFEDLKYPKF